MKTDTINNNTSVRIEEQGIRGVNTNYQAESKAKDTALAEKVPEKTDEIEERKKLAQKEAMKIATDTWEDGRIIEHTPKGKASSVNREKIENIHITFGQEKTANIHAKTEGKAIASDKQQIAKAPKHLAEEMPQVDLEKQIAKKKASKQEYVPEKITMEHMAAKPEHISAKAAQNISEEESNFEKIAAEQGTAEEESYFEKVMAEQKQEELQKAELKQEELKEEEQKEEEQKEIQQEELQKELEKEELQKAEEKLQEEQLEEKQQLRKEEIRMEMNEDMSETYKKMIIMDGIQNGIYDKVENLLDDMVLLQEDVKGIIVDENI
uniref:hypothetical protein n=1 Tax=Agathobacter sp. TaxID=2021311 RepID=UPI0040563BAA